MLEFRTIKLNDRERINEILRMSDFRGCEYTFANNMAWRRKSHSKICIYKDFYICGACEPEIVFCFPAGKGDYKGIFDELKKFSESHNQTLKISGVLDSQLHIFEESYPGMFDVKSFDADYDYIYNAEQFRSFSGKKFHSKRNHIAQFEKRYSYQLTEITENDFDDCIEFATNCYNDADGYMDNSAVFEQYAINTFFYHFDKLGLKGAVLRVDGETVAFSIGERINSDTFGVHIEKANTAYHGAYTVIANGFAKLSAEDFKYINREEDLGIEGLRKSKKSYYPEKLLKKNVVIFK
ncbi:MAG: DUF2156 domain-containing protein [Ruminococcus sp.]|jgi:hypothetical protein|nr:DUF2156 domain-containing protein [Ruminococcus sp.]